MRRRPDLAAAAVGRQDDERAEQAAAHLRVRHLVGVVPVRAGVLGDEPVDVAARPGATASWVTPATPSSALGTSTPCQCRVTPVGHVDVGERHLDQVALVHLDRRPRRRAVERVARHLLAAGQLERLLPRAADRSTATSGFPVGGPVRSATRAAGAVVVRPGPPPYSAWPMSMTEYVEGTRLDAPVPARGRPRRGRATTAGTRTRQRRRGRQLDRARRLRGGRARGLLAGRRTRRRAAAGDRGRGSASCARTAAAEEQQRVEAVQRADDRGDREREDAPARPGGS